MNQKNKTPKTNSPVKSGKWKRGGMAALLSVVFIAIVVVANILVSALVTRFPSMKIDLTSQGLNSLSEQAVTTAKNVAEDTSITFIGEEDTLRSSTMYGAVCTLADKLKEANSKISVSFVDPDKNPTFLTEYASDNLRTGSVLVSTEKRHKVLSLPAMVTTQQNSTTGAVETVSTADTDLASALEMVNLDKVPVVAAITGHDEILGTSYRAGFDALMSGENFEVQEVELRTAEIPKDATVLFIGAPNTDYTPEEIEKLKAFLNDTSSGEDRTILMTCYYQAQETPNLSAFLEEWGVKVEEGVVAESDSAQLMSSNPAMMMVNSAGEVLADNSYRWIISALSSPLTLTFDANNDISTKKLWTTSDTAYILKEEADAQNPQTSQQTVATLSTKMVQGQDNSYSTRNLAVFGSSSSFIADFLSSNAYGNGAYVTDLMHYLTGTDDSAVTITSNSVTTATKDIVMTQFNIVLLGLGVFTIALPLVILIAGLVIYLKRRHL